MTNITDKEFVRIRDYIKENYGISLADEKKSLVYSRLRNIISELGFPSFSDYFDYLLKDKTGTEMVRFIDKITTNHTYFMREADHFDYFRDTVLPQIERQYADEKDLRLWCAASSSGEEPYTLQMIILDYFSGKSGWNIDILATDISTSVLDKAIRGVYQEESVSPLPDAWKKKYFSKIGSDKYMVSDDVKKHVIYRKFNLMESRFPFKKKFQVVFCRNVMIYFEPETRDALVEKFYNQIENGGYLFVGHSESLSHTKTKFSFVTPAVYRK